MSLDRELLDLKERLAKLETLPAGVVQWINLPVDASQLITATRVFVQTHHTAISYADAATQAAYWSVKLPAGWPGRSMVVRLLWAPSSTNAGNCLWSVETYLQHAGTTLSSSAVETKNSAETANGTADRPQLATMAAHSLSNFAAGDGLLLRVARLGANGLDTFTGAAQLLAVELVITG